MKNLVLHANTTILPLQYDYCLFNTTILPLQYDYCLFNTTILPLQYDYFAPSIRLLPLQYDYFAPSIRLLPLQYDYCLFNTTILHLQYDYFAPSIRLLPLQYDCCQIRPISSQYDLRPSYTTILSLIPLHSDTLLNPLNLIFAKRNNGLFRFKVTGHAWQCSSENRHCALNISPIFIKFSPIIRWCM